MLARLLLNSECEIPAVSKENSDRETVLSSCLWPTSVLSVTKPVKTSIVTFRLLVLIINTDIDKQSIIANEFVSNYGVWAFDSN